MNKQDQIKALAELDGFTHVCVTRLDFQDRWWAIKGNETTKTACVPNYLTSYDAIIPLIQKQWSHRGLDFEYRFIQCLCEVVPGMQTNSTSFSYPECFTLTTRTPSQLCEALLRATGKWVK